MASPVPGCPSSWVQRAGHRVSTLDLVGPGFALFTGSSGAARADAAAAVSATLGVPIDVHSISTTARYVISRVDGHSCRVCRLMKRYWCVPTVFGAWRTGAHGA